MINIQVYEMEDSGISCVNQNCLHDPVYHHHIVGDVFDIKRGTTVVWIGGGIYCRGCVDELYQHIKSKLDTKLWAFH